MATPDNTIGQGRSEQAYIEGLKQEIRQAAATDAQALKNEFNQKKPSADKSELEMNSRVVESVTKQDTEPLQRPFPGIIGDKNTVKHHIQTTDIVVKETLKAFKANPNLVTQPPNSIGKQIIDRLVSNIPNPDLQISAQDSPYIYKIIYKAINGDLNSIDALTPTFKEIQYLSIFNRRLFEMIQQSFIGMARAEGLSEIEAKKKFKIEEDELGSSESGLNYTDAILYKKLGEKDRQFFASLRTTESFQQYCQAQIEDIKIRDSEYLLASTVERRNILSKKLSEKIKQRSTSIVYRIYEHILHERKNEAIEQLEHEGGIYNSVTVLYAGFRQRIESLMADVENKGLDITFATPKRKEVNIYDPVKKQFERTYRILPEYEEIHQPKDFLEFLMREIDSERTRIRYGFNLEFITRTQAYDPEKGLMKSIAEYATRLRSDQIDEIFLEETGKIVQTAVSLFDQRNEKFFALSNWRSDPGHMDEYFSHIDKMKEHVEKYIKHQYQGRYEDWMIERAIFNAKLVIYGMYFKPMLWYSYADPKLTGEGGPTYLGEGEQSLAVFDPGHLGKRFHKKEPNKHIGINLITKGVDFMPMNQVLEKYDYKDWEEYYKAWKATFEKGKAAYYDLAGKDCFGLKLLIDMGNITGCGGVDTLSGWRYFSAYKDWIRDYLDSSEKIIYPELEKREDSDKYKPILVLVEMWKRLENIGLDALENYVDKFIIYDIPAKGKNIEKENQKNAWVEFYGFLYDRYLKEGIGQNFLKDKNDRITEKEKFCERISELLTSKKISKQDKVGELRGWIYKSFSVILFERMPMKYVLLEKQRLSQNGVTLLSELRDYAGEQGWKIDGEENQFEEAIDDLLLAQTELRSNISDDMDKIEKRLARNLYGDLTNPTSEVNGGLGYVLDEKTIEMILQSVGKDKGRIDRAKMIYTKLKELVAEKPGEADWENVGKLEKKLKEEKLKSKKEKDPKEIESLKKTIKNIPELRELYTNRLTWFYEMYKGDDPTKANEFGFSVTSGELALKFISLSASGPDTIKRTATYCANTGEAISKYWSGMLNGLREVRKEKDSSKLYPDLLKLYESIEAEMGPGDNPNKTIMRLLQKAMYFFRKNSVLIPGLGALVDVKDWALRNPSSFAEEDAGEPGKLAAYEMDVNAFHKFVSQFEGDLGRSLIPEHPEEPLMKKVLVSEEYGILGKIAEKIAIKTTGEPLYRKVRDWANEISGQAIKHFHRSETAQFFWQQIHPKFWLAILIIAMLLGYKSIKGDFVIGESK